LKLTPRSSACSCTTHAAGTLPWDVTNPKTWPPEALDRLELRKRKKAGGDGEEAEHSLRAADMEWSDHNLGKWVLSEVVTVPPVCRLVANLH
jgi:hypothetical protein